MDSYIIVFADLVPFGITYNDTMESSVLDAAFGPIELDMPVVLFQTRQLTYYVSYHPNNNCILIVTFCIDFIQWTYIFPITLSIFNASAF